MLNLLWFLIIGAVAGWLAGQLTKGSGFGIWGNLVVGIIGAVLGGLIFEAVGLAAYGVCGSLIMATVGAIVFLFLLQVFSGKRPR